MKKPSKKHKGPTERNFDDLVVEQLRKDVKFREEYIKQTLEEDDPQSLILCLRRLVNAVGGVGLVAKETGFNRTQLYRTLSEHGRPEYLTLNKILSFLGMHFTVESNKRRQKLERVSA
jgi:probable addiction module antidote protein